MKLNLIAVLVCLTLGCGSENGAEPMASTSSDTPPTSDSLPAPSGDSAVTPPSSSVTPADVNPTTDPCLDVVCSDGQVCHNGECLNVPVTDPCLEVACSDGQVCQNGECLSVPPDSDASTPPPVDTDSGTPPVDPCASVTCQALELCVNGACVPDWVDPKPDLTCPLDHKSLLCHLPNGNKHTICVGNPAVPAHLAIGDTLGACQ